MKCRLIFMMLLMITMGQAQKLSKTEKEAILSQVNSQVWLPFMKALEDNDAKTYNGLHSEFVLRLSNDLGGKVWSGDDYKAYNESNFSRLKEKGIQQKIEFGFLERTISKRLVSDKGFYRYTYQTGNGGPKQLYGKFHVVSYLENDQKWKIILDHDFTNQEGIYEIGEDDFGRASSFIGT